MQNVVAHTIMSVIMDPRECNTVIDNVLRIFVKLEKYKKNIDCCYALEPLFNI